MTPTWTEITRDVQSGTFIMSRIFFFREGENIGFICRLQFQSGESSNYNKDAHGFNKRS